MPNLSYEDAKAIEKYLIDNGYTPGGGGGSDDYNDLNNKPSINNIPLIGNLDAEDLGLISEVNSENVLINTNTAVAGGQTQGIPDPLEQLEGWYFKNKSLTDKVNWYIPASATANINIGRIRNLLRIS